MKNITFFHMNEKDFSNKIYKSFYTHLIDFVDVRETYIMCPLNTLNEIRLRISTDPKNRLYYLGNGNYHYLTLVLLARLKEPFTLITFDHHNDAGHFPFPEMTSCGSWIQTAFEKIELLQEVIILGADAENKKEVKQEVSTKLQIINEKDLSRQKLKLIGSKIKTDNIYISIDRDFLSEKVVLTNWDQGKSSLSKMLEAIQSVSRNHKLVGADVCGDIVWDYRTLNQMTRQETLQQSIHVNEEIFGLLSDLLE